MQWRGTFFWGTAGDGYKAESVEIGPRVYPPGEGPEPVAWVTPDILAAMKRGERAVPGWKQSADFFIPLYAHQPVAVTDEMVERAAAAMWKRVEDEYTWEEAKRSTDQTLRVAYLWALEDARAALTAALGQG